MASGPPRKKIHQADRAGIEFGAYELHSSTLSARPSCLTMMHWDQCCFCYCLTIFGSIYVENILHSTYFCHQTLSRHLSSQEILERPPESQWKTLLGRRRVQRFYDQQQNLHSRLPHHVVHSWVSLSNLWTDCLYKARVRQTDSSSVQHAAIWVRKTAMIITKITEFDKQQLINNYWTLNEYQSTPLILAPSMKRITLELDKWSKVFTLETHYPSETFCPLANSR